MPVKPETRFYRRVNNHVPHEIYRQKISALYSNGTPDFWYSGLKDGWVEFKWQPKLSRNGVDPLKLLSPLQALWINRRFCEGRLVLVVIGTPVGCVILENGAWNRRVAAEEFCYSVSAVSAVLTEKFHVPSEILEQGSGSYKSDVQNPHDIATDSGHDV